MADLELVTDTHRIPDGSRPLIIGRDLAGLSAIAYTGENVLCFMARHNARHSLPPPPGCREVITPGDHCLSHAEHDAGGQPVVPNRITYYCAPCAIREFRWWNVSEGADA